MTGLTDYLGLVLSPTTTPAQGDIPMRGASEEPAADWLRSSVQRIEDLTALASNWNSYGSQPVHAEMAVAAVRFLLDNAYRDLPAPAIVPLPDGGVQFEWHRGGLDVEIAFSESEPGIYVEDHQQGQTLERSLSEAAAQLFQLRPRLNALVADNDPSIVDSIDLFRQAR